MPRNGDKVPRRAGAFETLLERHPLALLRREMDRLFEDFWPSAALEEGDTFSPRVDVSEDDSELRVRAELPGLTEKDIEVFATDDSLVIRGEKKAESKSEKEGVLLREISYGSFERRIPILAEIEPDKIDARFERGVLSIRLPKSQRAKESRKKIAVKTA